MLVKNAHAFDIAVSLDNVPRFLDYLGVSLAMHQHQGSEGADLPDGGFQEEYRCLLPISEDLKILTTWRITLDANGELAPISVTVEEEAQDGWQQAVEQLIRGTLVDMVNGRRGKFFQRHHFAYLGHPLDGEYYVNGFRIAPSHPISEFPFGLGEQVLVLDLEAEGISKSHAASLGKNQAIKIASLLSVFLDVGLYTIPAFEARWVYDGSDTCRSARLGYRSSTPCPTDMPLKGVECKPG
jgi:hypothetical protein